MSDRARQVRASCGSYHLADQVIESELLLPELQVAATPAAADWRIALSRVAAPRVCRPFHHWTSAHSARWASFAHDGERLILHFARTATFVVDEQARTIAAHPVGRARADAIRPVLLNQVMPLVLGAERLVMHASAVAAPAGAIVFAGPPGMGKSTLAAALALRGLPLITDDALIVDQRQDMPRAVASRGEPRLWRDSVHALMPHGRRFPLVGQRSAKRRISPVADVGLSLASQAAPIARIFLMSSPQDERTLRRVSPAEAVAPLTACTFVARVDDKAMIRKTFARVSALVSRVPVYRLGVERDFSRLDELCDVVRASA